MASGYIVVRDNDGGTVRKETKSYSNSSVSDILKELEGKIEEISDMYSLERKENKEKYLVLAETICKGKSMIKPESVVISEKIDQTETDKIKYHFYASDIVNQTKGIIYDKIYIQKELMFNHEVIDTIIPLVNFDIDKIQIV